MFLSKGISSYPGPLFVPAAILSYFWTNPIPAVFVLAAKICQLSCSPPSAILYHCLHQQPESSRGMWRLNVAASCLIKHGVTVCLHLDSPLQAHKFSHNSYIKKRVRNYFFFLNWNHSRVLQDINFLILVTNCCNLLIKVTILASSLRIIAKDNAHCPALPGKTRGSPVVLKSINVCLWWKL